MPMVNTVMALHSDTSCRRRMASRANTRLREWMLVASMTCQAKIRNVSIMMQNGPHCESSHGREQRNGTVRGTSRDRV